MNVARKRVYAAHGRDVLFPVKHSLIQVGNAPALRNVKPEQRGKLLGSRARRGVSPGAKRGKEIVVLVKGKIAVHNRGNAHRVDSGQRLAKLLGKVVRQSGKRALKPLLYIVERIRPVAVFNLVFPIPRADGDRRNSFITENR